MTLSLKAMTASASWHIVSELSLAPVPIWAKRRQATSAPTR